MGCSDSRRTVLTEEDEITLAERKLVPQSISPALVSSTLNKYSKGHIITDSQLVRIVGILGGKGSRNPAVTKQVYFGNSYFHAEPTGFDKGRVGVLFMLLSEGSAGEKTREVAVMWGIEEFTPEDVGKLVRCIVSISVIYCPLLANSTSLAMRTYVRTLHRCADMVVRSLTAAITEQESMLSIDQLATKLTTSNLSTIWTPTNVRALINESANSENLPKSLLFPLKDSEQVYL
jgi:hypothetical protein